MRRLLALILCLAVVLTGVYGFGYAEEKQKEEINNNALMLKSFSVIDKIEKDSKGVSRKELAKIIYFMTGLENIPVSNAQYFTDITPDDEYAGYINELKNLGYISGYEDGTFRPDDKALAGEAITMLTSVLGYTHIANQKGGYPSGYAAVAKFLGLLKNVKLNVNAELTYGDLYALCSNALRAEIMEITSVEGDNPIYTNRGKMLMEVNFDTYEVKGIIEGNDRTRLRGGSDISPYHVMIGGILYYIGETDIDEYLGYYAIGYCRESDLTEAYEIIYYAIPSERNEVVSINISDIYDISGGKIYVYDKNGNKKTYSYSLDAGIIYNEICTFDPLNISLISGKSGTVTLVSNSGKSAEAVIIEAYTDYVVSMVDYYSNILYDMYGNEPLNIDMQSDNPYVEILDKDGKELLWLDVKKYHTVSVYKSLAEGEQEYTKGIVNDEIISGTINSIKTRNGKKIIEINGTPYAVTNVCAVRENAKMNVGNMVNVSVNAFGEITAVRYGKAENSTLGYLFAADLQGGLSSSLAFRILNTNGVFVDYKVSDKVVVDGEKYSAFSSMLTHLEETSAIVNDEDPSNGFDAPVTGRYVQLISYEVNDENEIVKIDTACDKNKVLSTFENLDAHNQLYMKKANGVFYPTSSLVGGTVALNPDYIIFQTPQIANWTNAEEYKVKGTVLESQHTYIFDAYGIGNSSIGCFAIVSSEQLGGQMNNETRYAMVSGFGKKLHEDKARTYIEVYINGVKTEVLVADKFIYSDDVSNSVEKNNVDIESMINIGDIIMYSTDTTGLLNEVVRQYSAVDDKIIYNDSVGGNSNYAEYKRVIYAYANEVYDNGYIITPINDPAVLNSGNPQEIMWKIKCPVMVYDKNADKEKVRPGSLGEIVTYSMAGENCTRFIIRQYAGQVWSIFIIK